MTDCTPSPETQLKLCTDASKNANENETARIPVLVEAALAVLAQVLGPHRLEHARTARRLDVADDACKIRCHNLGHLPLSNRTLREGTKSERGGIHINMILLTISDVISKLHHTSHHILVPRKTNALTDDDHGRRLEDGDGFDHLLLVDLGAGLVHFAHDVRHARFEADERRQMDGLAGVILGERLYLASMTLCALLGKES